LYYAQILISIVIGDNTDKIGPFFTFESHKNVLIVFMKVIGIDLDSSRAIIYALEKTSDGIDNLTNDFKTLAIGDDANNDQVRNFRTTIFSFFDNIEPDIIAIITRRSSGRFAGSPISFKLEGLIQCYERIEVQFIDPLTINAFYKTKTFSLTVKHKYQEQAARLANYLLER